MNKEKELLRKQLELLAEQSDGATDRELVGLSGAMCEVYRELVGNRLALGLALLSAVGLDLLVCFFVHIKKTFGRDL